MKNKLVYRNAMRSIKDYFIYLLTMGFIAAFMFAFDMMLFSESIRKIAVDMTAMAAMMGLATFLIVLIVAWLINYMVRFMLEKRSREFGTYLLLGMKKKQISRMYLKENIFLGTIAFIAGCPLGWLLQQFILSIFDSMFNMGYQIEVNINGYGMLMTVGCYLTCFVLALIRNKHKFKSLCIIDLMTMDQKNEKTSKGKGILRLLCFFGSIIYFIAFICYVFYGNVTMVGVAVGAMLFILAIYLFYFGASSFVIRVIKKQNNHLFRKQHLFLYRQLSMKLKVMQFTMGSLTVLFTLALLFGTGSMMLSKYQKERADIIFPFDVIMFSEDVNDTFEEEKKEVGKDHQIEETIVYNVYENGSSEMNEYLYTNLAVIGDSYKFKDGTTNYEKIEQKGWEYYKYDTYMTLSVYNRLRTMIGLEPVSLSDHGYLIHIKKTLCDDLNDEIKQRKISIGNQTLELKQICTEEFSQSGHNGTDYILVVPDCVESSLTPYYSVMTMDLSGPVSSDLTDRLYSIYNKKLKNSMQLPGNLMLDEVRAETYEDMEEDCHIMRCKNGSEQIISFTEDILVSENAQIELKFILTGMVFPLMYINLVFVCVAFTILAVQQLSDSHKYRFRYTMLEKLGLKKRKMHGLVLRQLSMFYLCPIGVAVLLSIPIALFLSSGFNFYTGVSNSVFGYYGISLLIFIGVYTLYFVATYVGVIRNIEE